ncbi:hypothetical protein B0H63DRAFT_494934 [Podospora didyma]|uniref:Uncharacterized protein n=1 Tax=Podospora didyma TaxID=330526 RepID=A0AAE0TVL5_9PEZI|nr:hypothetical protein B0H63DRAFT_494934 [Podospora didyma]
MLAKPALLALSAGSSVSDARLSVGVTPYEQYSSSVGVLGCKVNTNRIAYWPMPVSCNDICSGGAYDILYDAWNFNTGQSATVHQVTGGALTMECEKLPADQCGDLIHSFNGGLPLSASNSINYLTSCLGQPGSWPTCPHPLGGTPPLTSAPVYNIQYGTGIVYIAP